MSSFLLEKKGVERTTSPWGRFTAPRENDISRFKECSSRNRAFFPRGKFTPLNDKAAGKVTIPREIAEGRCPRGEYEDRVVPLSKRRFLQEDRITPPKGKIFSLREKIADNFTSLRKKAREGHVSQVRPIFPKGGPSFLRYKMMFTRDKFISPREKGGKGHVSPIRLIFTKGGPSSPRYKVISLKYKFTSPKDMVENKPVFPGKGL